MQLLLQNMLVQRFWTLQKCHFTCIVKIGNNETLTFKNVPCKYNHEEVTLRLTIDNI